MSISNIGLFFLLAIIIFLLEIAIYDLIQKKHTLRRIYPLIGRFRWLGEEMGPKIHQYGENRSDGRPFSKDHRAYIYASSKKENNNTGFGTDKNFNEVGNFFIKSAFIPKKFDPLTTQLELPCAKIIGGKRRKPYHPKSLVNISGMSFGALSPTAVEAMNKGALLAGCYHTTGEGGLSPYHCSGADVVFQFGTGYCGVQEKGNFSLKKLVDLTTKHDFIKMVEIKLHQGAKPGSWSILPKSKMTEEIRQIRGLEKGQDSVSPGYHTAFSNIPELIEFVESIAEATGLPVGIKCGVGELESWNELALEMKSTGKGPDYIIVDGGAGGTGAAKVSTVDHLGIPFVHAFGSVYKIFQQHNIENSVVWIGSEKLGFASEAIMAMAIGCDMINVAREVMLSIGCIQSQLCHTNMCPSGVATQNHWRYSKLDPALKSVRCANYFMELRKNIQEMTAACGYNHPSEFKTSDILMKTSDAFGLVPLSTLLKYQKTNELESQYV